MKSLLALFCLLPLAACSNPTPKYRAGDIVLSKIGKLRGQILRTRCDIVGETSCVYIVRFPVASMEEQWMREYEIEPAANSTR